MSPKPRLLCADKDDLVWEKLDESIDDWYRSVRTDETYRAVGRLILKYKDAPTEVMHSAIKGGYNIVYRLEYKDGSSVVMRIPIQGSMQSYPQALSKLASDSDSLGAVPFPDEKVLYEVATMRYVAAKTTIPVPHIYHYGMAADNPLGLGPFIIMDYTEHHQNMSRALMDPTRALGERPVLNPKIDEQRLAFLYAQMANILLQLASLKFPRIGSLVEGEDGVSVKGRPLIANMNDIVVHTDAPASILPVKTYNSANDWYAALADMHMAQLVFQRRDAVEDADDARDKYVARQLFRTLAGKKQLTTTEPEEEETFALFSEDLRPTNVLLDKDDRVVGVIDWEFAYAAPRSFSSDPPWWLLLEEPESWRPGGLRGWIEACEPRLQIFLRVLEAEEAKRTTAPRGGDALSQRMRASWANRTWMLNYAARKTWAFDFIWWKFLDEGFFGPNADQDHKARLGRLSEPQREQIDAFMARKMEEGRDQEIAKWGDEAATERLAKLLV